MKELLISLSILTFAACTPSHSETSHKFLHNGHDHKIHGKTRGYVNVQITESKRDDDYIYLNAKISPMTQITNCTLKWKLPEGIKIDEGSIEENTTLNPHEEQSRSIRIRRDQLKEGHTLFFFANKEVSGEMYGASASYKYRANPEKESNQHQKVFHSKKSKKFIQ